MASTQRFRSPQKEGRLLLATLIYQENKILSVYKAAKLYNIPESTLQDRLKGVTP